MESGSVSSKCFGKCKKPEKTRRSWSTIEEDMLIQALKDCTTKGWKSENGFKAGYLTFLEDAMQVAFPGTDLRGNPHINSKIHVWKKLHASLATMLSKSGIGWNESKKMIEASDEVWEAYTKIEHSARSMRFRQFPYYHDWCEIFGNDRATGEHADSFATVVHHVLNMNYDIPNDVGVGVDDIFRVVEEAGESVSVTHTPSSKPSVATNSKGKKRKQMDEGAEAIVAAINNFAIITKDAMSDLIKQLANDESDNRSSQAMDNILDVLRTIPELREYEKVIVAELLVDNSAKLLLFLRLGNNSRVILAKRLLKSK